jgi:hypothetical protein
MASITLEYVQKNYDASALFIATKNTNNFVVVYSVHDGKFVTYWLNLQDSSLPLTEPLNKLEQSAYYLTWENERSAYMDKIGKERMITFNENFTSCWTLVLGEQRYLSKIHIVLDESWLNHMIPKVTQLIIISKSIDPVNNLYIQEILES